MRTDTSNSVVTNLIQINLSTFRASSCIAKYILSLTHLCEKLPRSYRSTSEGMPWVAWSTKPTPECGTRSTAASGPYHPSSSRSTCFRASSPRPRPRWCTSESGRARPCLIMARARLARAIAGRPPLGSWPPKANPCLTWTWWRTNLAWEIRSGEADLDFF